MMSFKHAQGLMGIATFLFLAWVCSEKRSDVRLRPLFIAIVVQFLLAGLILRSPPVSQFFLWISQGIGALREATLEGTSFVFGYVGGAPPPFAVLPNASTFIFGWQALPMVMVVSSLAMLLFHWRILPIVVNAAAFVLQRTLGLGGALGICAAAKVFLGQSEAPLLIRPYLPQLSRSELFTVMTLGMATTSAAVMVIYATILTGVVDNPIRHVLTSAIISLPAAVAVSRLMVPQTQSSTAGRLVLPYKFDNAMQAISQGANDGMQLFLNITAMLIVMLALVALGNAILAHIVIDHTPLSLQRIFGWLMAPVALLMGMATDEATICGKLLGTKIALNEVMAFVDLKRLDLALLTPRVRLMMTYALCGFANFSSVGIQISALGTMAPSRHHEINRLGMRALLAGTLTSCISATVVGVLML